MFPYHGLFSRISRLSRIRRGSAFLGRLARFRAFTLVEIMVILGIVGVLSAVLYPIGSTYLRQSRDTAREAALRQLAQAHSVYYSDHNSSYPHPYNATTEAHLVGCVRADVLERYMHAVPVSPSGRGYDEGCGKNGNFAYTTHPSRDGYMLMATMESGTRGNYQPGGSGAGALPEISSLFPEILSPVTWQRVISNLHPKTGKYLIVAGGNFDENTSVAPIDSPTPPSEGGSSPSDPSGPSNPPPSTTPKDCIGMQVGGYEVTLEHGKAGKFSREEYGVPNHGKTTRKISASCDHGMVTLGDDEEITVECIAPYRRKERDGRTECHANTPPNITSVSGAKQLSVGDQLHLTIVASDADGDALTYQVDGLVEGLELQGNIISGTSTVSRIPLTIRVSDGRDEVTRTGIVVYFRPVDTCPNPIYRHENGVTIKARECAEAGKEYQFEGETWYVMRQNDTLDALLAYRGYPADRIVMTKMTGLGHIGFTLERHGNTRNIRNWDTSNFTTLAQAFSNTNFHGDLSYWDVSNVEDMSEMFMFSFIEKQDLSRWNTGKVKNMSRMFHFIYSSDLPDWGIEGWDVSNVENMSEMFSLSPSVPDVSRWDVGRVKNMAGMFEGVYDFQSNISNWNTSNVTNMARMFHSALGFNGDVSDWNTSRVTSMYQMFDGADGFSHDLSSWNTQSIQSGACYQFAPHLPASHKPEKCKN